MSAIFKEMFENHRAKLIGLSYRITGSMSDAEDIVNESFIKWLASNHASIQSPKAWLTTVTTRLSIDHLKSAKVQREAYVGPWLPEPYVEDSEVPDRQYELDETVSIALMILLDGLTPGERASFILHDLFHYSFDEISNILVKTTPACRKLASRAREKVRRGAPTFTSNKDEYKEITSAFFEAVKNGELNNLVKLLKDNVSFHADGGGKVPASHEILQGRQAVSTFIFKYVRPSFIDTDEQQSEMQSVWFNGAPGFVISIDGKPISAFNIAIDNGQISKVFALRNPDKLRLFSDT